MSFTDDLFKKYHELLAPIQNSLSGIGSVAQNAVKYAPQVAQAVSNPLGAAVGQAARLAPPITGQGLQNVYKSYLNATPAIPFAPPAPTPQNNVTFGQVKENLNPRNYNTPVIGPIRQVVQKFGTPFTERLSNETDRTKQAEMLFNSFSTGGTTSNEANAAEDILKGKGLLHASPVEGIKELRVSKNGVMGSGVYLHENPSVAREASAMQGDGNIADIGTYNVKLKTDKIYEAGHGYPDERQIAAIKKGGYDGIRTGDGEVVVFDPKKVEITNHSSASPNDILQKGYAEIGSLAKQPAKSLGQHLSEAYTNWVDRFHPLVQASDAVAKKGKAEGFQLRPELDPKYTIRRFLGAQGIASQRFDSELKPIINEADQLKIDPKDLDLYLKSKRDINLADRGIKGSDAQTASERLTVLQQKYGGAVDGIANKLYEYQDKGLEELAQSGFLRPDQVAAIRNTNKDYVPFQRVMDQVDEYLGMPSHTAQQSSNPINAIKGSDKQIYSPVESIVANTFKQRAAIEKNRVAQSVVGLVQAMPELGFKQVAKAGKNAVTVWKDGQKQYWEVGENIATAVKGLDEESMNSFLKVLSVPAQILRGGATGNNPDFMLPNVVKDQFDAAANSKYGYTPFVDYAKGIYHLIKKDDVYQGWLKSGGSQSFGSMSGRSQIAEQVHGKTGTKNLFDWLKAGVGLMGKYSEQPTRLGLFNNALKKTGNDTLSAYESREGTLDFARMGAKMKVANSIIPFLNVGVQGFDRMLRSAKENPARFALNMTLYGVTPSVLTTLYNTRYHPQEYSEIPQYVKDSNFVLVTGRNEQGSVDYVTIPKGNVISYVANPVENLISYMSHTTPQTLDQLALQFLSSGVPVLGDGSSPKEIAIKTIGQNLPQAIKPITENLVNKSFYKYNTKNEQAKEIVPSYMQKKPAYEQSYDWTPEMYKTISRVSSAVGGPNVSPLMIQNFMEGYFAGYTKIPSQLVDMVKAVGNGQDVNKNQVPIFRRFMQETLLTKEQQAANAQKVAFQRSGVTPGQALDSSRAPLVESASAAEKQSTRKPKQKINTSVSLAKDKAQQSGKPVESNGVVYYQDQEKTKSVPTDRKLDLPKVSGVDSLDKLDVAQAKTSIDQKIQDVKKLYDIGYIDKGKASDQITQLEQQKKDLDTPKVKKAGGRKPKKIKVPKMKRISLKIPKAKAVKTVKIKPIKTTGRRIRPIRLKGKRITRN